MILCICSLSRSLSLSPSLPLTSLQLVQQSKPEHLSFDTPRPSPTTEKFTTSRTAQNAWRPKRLSSKTLQPNLFPDALQPKPRSCIKAQCSNIVCWIWGRSYGRKILHSGQRELLPGVSHVQTPTLLRKLLTLNRWTWILNLKLCTLNRNAHGICNVLSAEIILGVFSKQNIDERYWSRSEP